MFPVCYPSHLDFVVRKEKKVLPEKTSSLKENEVFRCLLKSPESGFSFQCREL